MSMFYELMMRNKMKVEEMPLTVVGSPTIVDGVVSGFSASDYIRSVSDLPNSIHSLECICKFNMSAYNDSSYSPIMCPRSFGWLLNVTSGKKISIYISSTGSSWNVANNKRGQYEVPLNTDIYIKLVKNSSTFKVFYSLNNVNWVEDISVDMSADIVIGQNKYIIFGNLTNQSLFGSIDINNSYIVLDGTKYIFTIGE